MASKMDWMLILVVLVSFCKPFGSAEELGEENVRNKKVLGMFNVVKFPNDNCNSTSTTNGTCYTSSECLSKGGKSEGSCASGYGVCCTFKKMCGSTSAENSIYLDSDSQTDKADLAACSYKICPKSSDICRIRFDFVTFVLNGPSTVSAGTTTAGSSIGDCTTDRFSINAPGSKGSPVICGTNTGQHMILDVASQCLEANFYTSSSSPSWLIYVTQYACSNEMGGPSGCLQFFTGTTGTFTSFNYQSSTSAYHLSNQDYDICFRRESGNSQICFYETTPGSTFGLSVVTTTDPTTTIAGVVNAGCDSDYVSVYGGYSILFPTVNIYRNCGRIFSATMTATETASISSGTVCSKLSPFRVSFITDDVEVTTGTDSTTNETAEPAPAGTFGFSLKFEQT